MNFEVKERASGWTELVVSFAGQFIEYGFDSDDEKSDIARQLRNAAGDLAPDTQRDTLRARIAELEAAAVPVQAIPGWQWVPVEPTDKMLLSNDVDVGMRTARKIYKAMLSAAPTPVNQSPVESPSKCDCEACHSQALPFSGEPQRMILCAKCGNKRCPHANDHRNACTGSNDVGQPGSSWEHVKPFADSRPAAPSPQAEPQPNELKIEIYGQAIANWMQHNNKGVRITHIPTGTVAECETERSQHANRDIAYKALLGMLRGTQPTQGAQAQPPQLSALQQYDLERSPEYQKGRADGRAAGYDVGYRHAKEQLTQPTQDADSREAATNFTGKHLELLATLLHFVPPVEKSITEDLTTLCCEIRAAIQAKGGV